MIYPKFIKGNSCVGIPAPSSGAYNQEKINQMLNAKKNLETLGYNLIISENLLKCHKARSASSIVRATEINNMIVNKDIDMILCATGGEFLVEILPYVNFDLLKENTKFFVGFSDSTGLLYPITTKYDIATIYGHNFSSFGTDSFHKSHTDFLEIIKGNLIEQHSYYLYE